MKENAGNPLHLTSLNHVSLLCRSIEESMNFYQKVLGFFPIRRPESLNFDGAWLFGHGIGIHLLLASEPGKLPNKTAFSPKDNHISFQCESLGAVEKKLEEMEIEYVRSTVEEVGIQVDQLFFHDPDGFMIEICNCDSLPIVPLVRRRNGSVLLKSQTPSDGAASTPNSDPPCGPPVTISAFVAIVCICIVYLIMKVMNKSAT